MAWPWAWIGLLERTVGIGVNGVSFGPHLYGHGPRVRWYMSKRAVGDL